MNSTPAEFARALRQAFGASVTETAGGVQLTQVGVSLHFALTGGRQRQLGALRLDLLEVEIAVCSGEAAAVEELLARVDRATQRGGG